MALLPDKPALRRHVLVADLARLRRSYPATGGLREALVGVWLPDALSGAGRRLWRTSFGLQLDDVSSFASAGFHPAEVTVAEGGFAPPRIRERLTRSGYRARGSIMMRGADGSFDPSTEAGRLVLSALNRVIVSPTRVTAASTSALASAAAAGSRALSADGDFAAAAAALDPITAAIVIDAHLVRPPSGVPTAILPEFPARLVAVGIDDQGPQSRTVKIALVYGDSAHARSDAALIEDALAATLLPGAQDQRFSDIAFEWHVAAEGRTVVITALLPANGDPGTWRLLVERGDLGTLVRQGS